MVKNNNHYLQVGAGKSLRFALNMFNTINQ
jgi:hypothetical protein